MKCMYCQATMEQKTTPHHIDRNGYHLQFDAVPAWVCSQCGEVYFEEKEVQNIQNVIRSIEAEAPLVAKSA